MCRVVVLSVLREFVSFVCECECVVCDEMAGEK